MKIILFFVVCFFGVLSSLEAVASDVEKPPRGELRRLPEFDRKASVGMSRFYSENIDWTDFHKNGDKWPQEKLAHHFLNADFQHYVYEITGVDMNDDSTLVVSSPFITGASDYSGYKWKAIKRDGMEKCFYLLNAANLVMRTLDPARALNAERKVLIEGEIINIPLAKSLRGLLEHVIHELKSNPVFVGLGIGFLRNKIVMEKLSNAEYFSDAIVEAMQRIGVLGNDQQAAFYYWMKQTLENSVKYIRQKFVANGGKLGEFKEGDEKFLPAFDETLQSISHFTPTFITSHEWAYSALVLQAEADGLVAFG